MKRSGWSDTFVRNANSMPGQEAVHPVSILRFRQGDGVEEMQDLLAVEEPLQIRLSEGGPVRSLAITMRTPGDDINLALGFLFSEGIIAGSDQIKGVKTGDFSDDEGKNTVSIHLNGNCPVDWARLQRNTYTSSSCGVCGKTSLEQLETLLPFGDEPAKWSVASALILQLPGRLRSAQQLFDQTGGIHAAALFTPAGELLHHAEDVGRHNALDKVIGHAFQAGDLPLANRILLLSGRASFELLQKSAMAGIPFVVAVGAPSSLAVTLAQELGITLCGFIKKNRFNCYSYPYRILK